MAIKAALADGEGGGGRVEANARDGKCGLMEILNQGHFNPLLEVPRQTDIYWPRKSYSSSVITHVRNMYI